MIEDRYRVMIVDDEPLALADLAHMLSRHPDVEVCWRASGVSEAAEILVDATPDIAFLDVMLGDGNGFDIVPLFPPSTEIIFVTAYNEHAVRAFEVNALDYLTKPVGEERLEEAIQRCFARTRVCPEAPGYRSYRSGDTIFIQTGKERRFVSLARLQMIRSDGGNYLALHFDEGETLLVRSTLDRWEGCLPEVFVRIHRTTIVNLHAIRRFWSEGAGVYCIEVAEHEAPLRVSRGRAATLKKLMDGRTPG